MGSGGIFISHARVDRLDKALPLARALQSEGARIWFDLFEIEEGENWLNDIRDGLENASAVVVVWTKAASERKWVDRELAKAEELGIPIIPCQFDDTSPHIIVQTVEPVDFRGSRIGALTRLMNTLSRFSEEEEIQKSLTEDRPWHWLADPTRWSRFLDENNYLDIDTKQNFAVNDWTSRLVDLSYSIQDEKLPRATRFVSLVCVPVRDRTSLLIDFRQVPEYFGMLIHPNTGTRKVDPSEPDFRKFPLHGFNGQRPFNRCFARYEYVGPMQESAAPENLRRYLRIVQGGAIEYADSYHLIVGYSDRFQDSSDYLWELNFTGLLGITWQILHLTADIYRDLLAYDGRFQLLINFVGIKNAIPGGFAFDSHTRRGWNTPRSVHSRRSALERFMCPEEKLQFVYEIDANSIAKDSKISQTIIEDLSSRLQPLFSLVSEPYHYLPDTEEFPWDQYFQIWR